MFKVIDLNRSAQSCRLFFLLVLLVVAYSKVYADFGHRNDAQSNQLATIAALPENLDKLTLVELLELRKQRYSQLQLLRVKNDSQHINEQLLLKQLLAYDNVRLKIVEVIKKLINEYNVQGEYKKKLLGFCQTFNQKIKVAHNRVRTLSEYKVYGAHFALVYASLVYTFKENPEFYANYQQDIEDTDSTLGAYINELNESYRKVELARKEYDVGLVAQQIMRSIAKLDGEIVRHRTRLLSQH